MSPSKAGLEARNAALETVLEAQRRPAAAAKPRSPVAKGSQEPEAARGSPKSHTEDDIEVRTAWSDSCPSLVRLKRN